MPRPVLPLPVMPTHSAWVTRSFESYRTRSSVAFFVAGVVPAAEVEHAEFFEVLHVLRFYEIRFRF